MTISYPVYYFFTGDVLFTAQIDCSEDAPDAIKKRHAVLWAVANDQSLLRGANLRDADLRYANLRDAYLSDANLRDADLSDANLSGANLRYANLRDADLSDANLRDANLPYADLRGADLRYADLSGANLRDANLRYADLRDADLSDADLRGADLRYADLRYADLRGADLRGADLRGADLRGAVGFLPLPVADPRGYHHHAILCEKEWRVRAGCRDFSISEAREHWTSDDYDGPNMVRDTMAFALDWLEKQPVPKKMTSKKLLNKH